MTERKIKQHTNVLKNKLSRTLFLLFACLLTALPMALQAETVSGTTGTLTWTFNTDNGTLTISGTGAMPDYSPSALPWYNYRNSITTVNIANSVTSIGNYALYGCIGLTSITIPNSVTSIGNYALYGCIGLTSITIPNSVTSIGNNALYGCIGLTSITIPSSVTSIGYYTFARCSGLTSITIPENVTSVGGSAFYECKNLTSVNFNAINCTVMGFFSDALGPSYAFENCTALTTVNIGNQVTQIPAYAFASCNKLTSITIPESVTKIGIYAFRICTALTVVNYNAKNCTSTGSSASPIFSGCTALATVNIGNQVEQIPEYAFAACTSVTSVNYNAINCTFTGSSLYPVFSGCTALTTVNIGNQVTHIPEYAFAFCRKVGSITIPNSVTSIGSEAFWMWDSLKTVSIPNSVTSIGSGAFAFCKSLTSVTIPSSVTSIEYWMFVGCTSLTSVTIPGSVTSIGSEAFSGCTKLTSVTCLGTTPPVAETDVFSNVNVSVATLYVPATAKTLYQTAPVWKDFGTITGTGEQPVTGVSLNKTTTTINVNATEQLTATVAPANATNKIVTWSSSNAAIATVSDAGLVTAKSAGTATITVTTADGGRTATCAVTVVQPAISVTGVSLNKTTTTINVNATEQLTATVAPANATNKAVSWSSSNAAIATVSTTGLVTAKSAGTANITVTTEDGGRTATCAVTVVQPAISVTGVSLNKTTTTINVNATEQLTATVAPVNATNKAVSWSSSNAAIATVSDAGLVTAKSAGTANITVTTADGGRTATCAITVVQPAISVTGVSLNKTATTINVNATEQLTATVAPENASNKTVSWYSSNDSVARVDNGLVTAKSAGTATITVTTADGGHTATCTVTVPATYVMSVSLNKTTTTIERGVIEQLTATIVPANATNQAIIWSSSNAAVATVVNGLVTATGIGTATITVTTYDGGHTATCVVTVIPPSVTGVSLNKTATTINVGDTEQLTATVTPDDASNKAVSWYSSNDSVARVDNGLVTATGVGTANIVAITEDGWHTATCTVTVPATYVMSVSLNKITTTIVRGVIEQLTATIVPANATNQAIIWSSSNAAVATVVNGLVTAAGIGTATITVTTYDGGHTATCVVTVIPPSVTGVSLNKTATTINVNATEQLTATVAPENASNKTVIWYSSNDSVATVSSTGLVTAKSIGTATITVTTADGGHTKTCTVTVEDLPLTLTALALDGSVKIALNRNVRLKFTFSGGVPRQFRTAESEAALNSAAWQTYSEAALFHAFATTAHGHKTVYAQLQNGKGATAVRSAKIIYKPAHPKQELRGFAINAGAWSTDNRTVTLNHSVVNGVPTLYSVSENPLLVGKVWLPYKELPLFTLSNGEGLKEVYFAVANAADTSEMVSAQIWLNEPVTESSPETEAASDLQVKLYPNPVETTATVEVTSGKGKVQVSVYDMSGRMYLSRTFDTPTFSLDLTDCPSGILLVRITNNGNSVIRKVIKN